MTALAPPPRHRSTPSPSHEMQFQWLRCDLHFFLGVSTLVVGDSPTGTCFPEGGPPHVVARVELEAAA